ncbi:MAG: hypothetical protein V3U11_00710, partial [Planctomycetota bacterium]
MSNTWVWLLDTPQLNDNNLALMEQGVWGLGGPLGALFQPASHYLVRFLPGPGWTAVTLVLPWILAVAAGAVCLWLARRGGWSVLGAVLFGFLALLATPHAVVLPLLLLLVGGRQRWRLVVAIGVPASLLLLDFAYSSLVPAEQVWRRFGREPLAQVFLAEELAAGADYQRQQEARQLLEQAVPELRPSLLKLAAMEQLLHLRFGAGDRQGASE